MDFDVLTVETVEPGAHGLVSERKGTGQRQQKPLVINCGTSMCWHDQKSVPFFGSCCSIAVCKLANTFAATSLVDAAPHGLMDAFSAASGRFFTSAVIFQSLRSLQSSARICKRDHAPHASTP